MLPKYELFDHDEGFHDKHWCLKILDGELEGLVYQYDTVAFNEDKDGQGVLDFNILTVENPSDYDLTAETVTTLLGNILVDIIEEQLADIAKEKKD